jgi:hypothetical protein
MFLLWGAKVCFVNMTPAQSITIADVFYRE